MGCWLLGEHLEMSGDGFPYTPSRLGEVVAFGDDSGQGRHRDRVSASGGAVEGGRIASDSLLEGVSARAVAGAGHSIQEGAYGGQQDNVNG